MAVPVPLQLDPATVVCQPRHGRLSLVGFPSLASLHPFLADMAFPHTGDWFCDAAAHLGAGTMLPDSLSTVCSLLERALAPIRNSPSL